MGSNSASPLLFVVILRFHCGFGRKRKRSVLLLLGGSLVPLFYDRACHIMGGGIS